MNRRCPYEERETREGFWVAVPTYHFHCRCPDHKKDRNCDQYFCMCAERRAVQGD